MNKEKYSISLVLLGFIYFFVWGAICWIIGNWNGILIGLITIIFAWIIGLQLREKKGNKK